MGQCTVFEQVIKLISRAEFQSIVEKHNADKGVRTLDCWTWFGSLLFGQLTGHDSIRAIERVFTHSRLKFAKLGFGSVCRSTLADANSVRDLAVFEDIFIYVLNKVRTIAPIKTGFKFQGQILALDSTTIDLCLSLCPWAMVHAERASVKFHTAIDIANDLPEFTVIEHGKAHDLPVAKKYFKFKTGSTIIYDRNYLEWKYMQELTTQDVYFVTRTRDCFHFKVYKSQKVDRTRGHICDQIVYPKKTDRSKVFKGKLRRINYRDPETGKKLVFLTNRFDLATQTICDLYKARWKVELFFKTLKQNLKIKKFLGTTANAVKAQIWVALIAYLLVQYFRFYLKSNISIPDAMAVVGTLLLLREPLSMLLGNLVSTKRHPPPLQLFFQF
jgi:hypothetical protein